VFRTAAARPCIPNTQTPTKRTADALVQHKSAELRANQEAEFVTEYRDKKSRKQCSAFWTS